MKRLERDNEINLVAQLRKLGYAGFQERSLSAQKFILEGLKVKDTDLV